MKKEPANSHIIYLTPMERKTTLYNKEHTHYIVATSIPREWKDKSLKVTIEPAKGLAKEFAEPKSSSWETVEKQLDEELKKKIPNPHSLNYSKALANWRSKYVDNQ